MTEQKKPLKWLGYTAGGIAILLFIYLLYTLLFLKSPNHQIKAVEMFTPEAAKTYVVDHDKKPTVFILTDENTKEEYEIIEGIVNEVPSEAEVVVMDIEEVETADEIAQNTDTTLPSVIWTVDKNGTFKTYRIAEQTIVNNAILEGDDISSLNKEMEKTMK